jgi:hypothetical protein
VRHSRRVPRGPLLILSLALFACARGAAPSTPAAPPARTPTDPAVDPRLAACEQGDWTYCWLRAHDGSIPGHAMASYRAGCQAGVAGDCMRVGVFVDAGDPKRPAIFQKACDGGVTAACDSIAGAWAKLAQRERDPARQAELYARAFALFEDGCARGDAGACSSLALAYASGDGVAVDAAQARRHADRSCTLSRLEPCPLRVDVECALGGVCPERPR